MARIGDLLATLLRRRTPDGDPLSDAVLLDRFARTRDSAAFELLVWRHGPMVLTACRRVLRDDHAAEDAFQAAFLVLARKAGGVRGSAAGWLHRVALRVCLRMKRRLPPVSLDADPVAPPSADAVEAAERSAIVDEEVGRLPDWLRVPVVVCYLQGHTTERAAEVLGIPRGTVLSRLATARKRLAVRLTARGVAPLFAAVAVTDLSADAGRVVGTTAVSFTLGQSMNSVPVQLALEVLAMTKRTTVAVAVAALVLVAGLGTGVGLVAAQGQAAKPTPATAATADPPAHPLDKAKPAPVEPKDVSAERRDRLTVLLRKVDDQISALAGTEQVSDPDLLRTKLKVEEQRLGDLASRMWAVRTAVPPELVEQVERANERLAAAKQAPVPADVLTAALQLHPKVSEATAKLDRKQRDLEASKLPKDDAGRKALMAERDELAKAVQDALRTATPEVQAYLRTPGVVEAQKALQVAQRKVEQVERMAIQAELEYHNTEKSVTELRRQLAKSEPVAEELTWLKEKRKRLKQELLELELKEVGIGK